MYIIFFRPVAMRMCSRRFPGCQQMAQPCRQQQKINLCCLRSLVLFCTNNCKTCCMLSSGQFPGVLISNIDVSERCLYHLHRQVVKPVYEDGTLFRNVGIQNWDAGELTRKKAYNIQNTANFEIRILNQLNFREFTKFLSLYKIPIRVLKSMCKYFDVLTLRDRCPCFQSAESVRTLGGTSLFFTWNWERLQT